jgi:sialic acid synthase SpsE
MKTSTPLVIAEAGVNHNGDLGRAKEMVHVAATTGADYIKFQAFSAQALVSHRAATAAYQKANAGIPDQLSLLRGLELSLEDFAVLAQECRYARIGFLVTPFDAEMVPPLVAMGMDRIKIPSGEITNEPMLRDLARFRLPVILSTGMATLDEVDTALASLTGAGVDDITILHCTSLYPAPPESLNLRAMAMMAAHFGRPVGYSDHSLGDTAAIAAAALGATVIEKHFTLDRSLPGPDHKASLEPDEFAVMVRKLRHTVSMLGDGAKRPVAEEVATASLVRRSWHARHDLRSGTNLAASDLVLKRPAHGLPPSMPPIGRRLANDVAADAPVRLSDLEGEGR